MGGRATSSARRACVCSRMLLSSAVSAPLRTTRSGGSTPAPDLEFGRPPPDLPVGEEEFATDVDLGVAGVADPAHMLSLPCGNLSVAQAQSGREVLGLITSALLRRRRPQ